MAATRYMVVHLVVGTAEVGLWCSTCSLPSRVRFPIYRLTDQGVAYHCAVLRCTEHQPAAEGDD